MGIIYMFFVSLFYTTLSAVSFLAVVFVLGLLIWPQQTEINDNLEISDPITESSPAEIPEQTTEIEQEVQQIVETEKPIQDTVAFQENKTNIIQHTEVIHIPTPLPEEISFSVKIYKMISDPIIKVVNTPKVNSVIRNIGTCVVNGAMELFSYYLPAPFMPLIASAAGLLIPFEPVVMLKEKMPVTTYRRALQTAMTSFLRTFDRYKMFIDDEDDYDPYMTRRFNRRVMNNDQDKLTKAKKENYDN